MKQIALILTLFIAANNLWAQTVEEKINAARIGYITQRLNLTADQAQLFWPIFNEFEAQKEELKQELKQARAGISFNNMTDDKANELISLSFKRKKDETALEEEYINKLRGVITPVQILKLIKAEQDFKQELLDRVRQRQQQMGGRRRFGGGR